MSQSLSTILECASPRVEPLSRDEAAEWLEAWTAVYGQRGVFEPRWLVFERTCPALRRYKATRAYHALEPEDVIVLNHTLHDRRVTVEAVSARNGWKRFLARFEAPKRRARTLQEMCDPPELTERPAPASSLWQSSGRGGG